LAEHPEIVHPNFLLSHLYSKPKSDENIGTENYRSFPVMNTDDEQTAEY
jgi:hypothetical protein